MVRGITIILLFAALIFVPWYFLKSPLDAAYCLMSGNEWASQGNNERYCKEVFSDYGSFCSINSNCKSRKCVIGSQGALKGFNVKTGEEVEGEDIALGVFGNILNPDIMGKCSRTNQSPCYSSEILINDNRIIINTPACE